MTLRQLIVSMVVLVVIAATMLFYAWRLREHAALTTPPVEAVPPVVLPKAGPTENATLWVADDNPGVLRAQSSAIPLTSGRQQKARQILRALMSIYTSPNSAHPLHAGAEIRAVYLVTPGVAVIDVNSAFAEGQTSGVLAEELTIASLVQSLTANIPGITDIKILVDGKEKDTLAGHADLSGTYDVLQVSDLARELSSQ